MHAVDAVEGGTGAVLRLLDASLAAAGGERRTLGLLLVQVANFDRIAAAFGPRAANDVVAVLAERLQRVVRPTDRTLRAAEAKFAVVIDPVRNQGVLLLAAHRVAESLAAPVPLGGASINVVARIGVAPGLAGGSAEGWLQQAEAALLSAAADDASYAVYAPAQAAAAADSFGLELELEAAIRRNELEVFYQPKVSAATFQPCGAEALLRWTSPRRGSVSPDVFVPLADKLGLIEPLTTFVLNTALRQSADWPQHWGPLAVAVNVTPRVIESGDLCGIVEGALGMWDAPPERLLVEMTEGAIMRNPEASFAVLRELRELGVQISIDDFGTGYSSLAYFKSIPADELKIDKSFVLNMLRDEGDRNIVRTVIELAKSFGLEVTAEGVEDAETAAVLAELRCDKLQGYHYSQPLPQVKFVAWLDDYRHSEQARRAAGAMR